jgi:amino acid adenylation domain-containing protein
MNAASTTADLASATRAIFASMPHLLLEGGSGAGGACVVVQGDATSEDALELLRDAGRRLADVTGRAVRVEVHDAAPGACPVAELPRPDAARSEFGGVAYVAPATPSERVIAAAWEEALGAGRVGRHDRFNGVDGYSLLAVQVAATLRARVGAPATARLFAGAAPVWLTAARLDIASKVDSAPRAEEQGRREPACGDVSPELPLSDAQNDIWHGMQAAGETSFHVALAWEVDGGLDGMALRESIAALVRRHDALRLGFRFAHDAGVLQRVTTNPPAWHKEPAASYAVGLQRLRALAQAKFELQEGTPVRAVLIELDDGRSLFGLTFHHLVVDGLSIGRLIPELSTHYAAILAGAAVDTPAPSFLGLLRGHSARRASSVAHADVANDVAAPPLIAADPPTVAEASMGAVEWDASGEETCRLREFIAAEGSTLFQVLAATLQVFLSRHAHCVDTLIGVPTGGRDPRVDAGVIGCFTRLGFLHGTVNEAATVAQQLRVVAAAAPELDEVPAAATRNAAASCMQAMLNLNHHDTPPLQLGQAQVRELERPATGAPADLCWVFSVRHGRLHGRLEYDASRHRFEAARLHARRFQALLQGFVSDSRTRLNALPWMDAEERAHVRSLGQGAELERLPAVDASELLKRLAKVGRRRADGEALVCGADRWTYRELFLRAAHWAARLADAGIEPGTPVVNALPRCLDSVAATLAIWRAGATFVPVDVGQCVDRLSEPLSALHSPLWLLESVAATEQGWLQLARRGRGIVALREEAGDALAPARCDVDDPFAVFISGTSPSAAPAYVLFTSGSTGRPKGVLVGHESLAAHVDACLRRYGLGENDRVLQFAHQVFDTSIEQWLVALAVGAAVVVRGRDAWSLEDCLREMDAERVTVADLPTSYGHELAARGGRPLAHLALRLLIVGGEPARGQLDEAARRWYPLRLLNAYGPTEATITACVGEAGEVRTTGGAFVPVGRPLDGTGIAILDAREEPVPVGVTGEIWISGPRLARGYLDAPGATAQAFMPNPHGPAGARRYRTGDLGRYLHDGQIEFVRRLDRQFKVRGHRVEAAEVEAAIVAAKGVRAVAVDIVLSDSGEAELFAAVVPHGPGLVLSTLAEHVASQLPPAFVPAVWACVPELPLTASGKVDRDALRQIPRERTAAARAGRLPCVTQGRSLEALLACAAEALPGTALGPDDDLIAHGFHSLVLMQLARRCEERLGVAPRLREMLRARTLRRLAASLDDANAQLSIDRA